VTTIGVLLAAGGGTRFSGPTHKLLAPYHDKVVVQHALESLIGAGLDESAVVVGAVDLTEVLPEGVVVLVNPNWADGQATSLACAVDYATARGHDVLVIGLGDQPMVPASAWRAVSGSTASPIATASFNGQRRPPVRLAQQIWELLPRSGDEGARVVMSKHPEFVSVIDCVGEPLDIDTVEDLDR
jgi:molybdenum cofactor cytidylyltransferase